MKHYIDKDALVAEIERRTDELWALIPDGEKVISDNHTKEDTFNLGKYTALELLDKFINTLEVKEVDFIWNDARKTIPEDSSNQIICIKEDDLAVATVGKLVHGTKKWAYLHDLLNISNVQVKEVDLEKEIEEVKHNYKVDDNRHASICSADIEWLAKHFFELGLSQKG